MAAAALAAWTLLVWGVRIRNAEGDAWAVGLSLTFVALAAAVLVQVARCRRPRPLVAVLGGWTAAVWAVRAVDIALLSDHGTAFVVVHLALAAVSVALAGLAWRSQRDVEGEREAAASAAGLQELGDR